jgi:hypothetical protein
MDYETATYYNGRSKLTEIYQCGANELVHG